jgi:hypothetical protein
MQRKAQRFRTHHRIIQGGFLNHDVSKRVLELRTSHFQCHIKYCKECFNYTTIYHKHFHGNVSSQYNSVMKYCGRQNNRIYCWVETEETVHKGDENSTEWWIRIFMWMSNARNVSNKRSSFYTLILKDVNWITYMRCVFKNLCHKNPWQYTQKQGSSNICNWYW